MWDATSRVAERVGNQVKQEMKSEVVNHVEDMEKNMQRLVNQTKENIRIIEKESFESSLIGHIITLVIALIVCIIVTKFTLPTPEAIFTDKQLETYHQGKNFQNTWDKLEKWEKDRLEAIAKGEAVPKMEEVDSTKKHKRRDTTNSDSTDTEDGNSGTSSDDGSQQMNDTK